MLITKLLIFIFELFLYFYYAILKLLEFSQWNSYINLQMGDKLMSELYGRIMPASKKQINDKTDFIKKQTDALEKNLDVIKKQFQDSEKEIKKDINKINQESAKTNQEIEKIMNRMDSLEVGINELSKTVSFLEFQEKKIFRASNESVWAHIFHDTIEGSLWLKNKIFYPGRWAAGYPFLYVLYRSLNEFQPRSILELGLGQTTRIIGQYAAYNKECRHIVTEHDTEWINIFKRDFELSDNTEILKLDIEKKSYYNTVPSTAYVDFAEKLKGKKFDMISIDAPFGGDHLEYSRMDILQILPDCLNEDFVIFLDDYNRKGEQNMMEKLKEVLNNNQIKYTTGNYGGNKDTFMVTSESLKFLCTM